MIGTALFHPFLSDFVPKLQPLLGHLSRPKKEDKIRVQNYSFQDHIVILGFNETGLEIAEFYREQGKDVVVIDLDWKLHKTFLSCYKGTKHLQDKSQKASIHSSFSQRPGMIPFHSPRDGGNAHAHAQLGNVHTAGHPFHHHHHHLAHHHHTAGQVVYGAAFGSAPMSPAAANGVPVIAPGQSPLPPVCCLLLASVIQMPYLLVVSMRRNAHESTSDKF